MRPKRVWMYAFVILMLLSWPCGIQSAIAANKAKSVSTKAPAQASVIKESPSSQSTEESEIFPQLGHKNGINSIAITPDGKYALSGSQDRTIKLWEVSSGREIKTFIGHSNFILSLAISRDGKFALSGSEDSTMKLWNISSGREVRTFTGHTWPIELVAFSLDGKLAYSGSWNNMKIWDIAAGKEIKTVKWNADHVRNIAFSSDGNIAATINSNVLTVWDIKEGKEKWSIKNDDLFDVAISPDGKLVVSTRKEVFTFWDASTGKVKETFTALPREPDWVNKLSFSHDGRYMLSFFGVKGTVKLWDVSTGKTLKELKIPGCSSLTISPDKKYIFSGDQGNDGKIIQWEMLTGKEIKIFRGYVDMVSLATFSPDGRNILSGREKLALWDISTGNRIKSFQEYSVPTVLSSDGIYALSSTLTLTKGTFLVFSLKLWNMSSGKKINSFGPIEHITSVALSPDGKYALSGGEDSLRLWDISTGQEKYSLKGHKRAVLSAAFSPDGNYILSGSPDSLKLWEVSTGREKQKLDDQRGNIWAVAFSPDGQCAISGNSFDEMDLWEISTGRKIKTFKGHSGWVRSVAYSTNGKYVLSGSLDDTIKLWDVSSGKELKTFKGHSMSVMSVAFSSDNKYVVSGGWDGTTRLWDISTGKEMAQFIEFKDGEWITITPEGYYNSSLNGHKNLNIRMGNKVYGIDQFYDVFYRPDIVMAKLKGEDIKPLITLTIDDAIKNPPPEVDFTSVPSDSTTPTVKVCYQAKNTGGGIGEVRLFHNGKLIQSDGFYKDVAKTAEKIQLASLDSKSIREDMRSIVIKSKSDISPIASKAKGDIFKDCVVVDAVPGENEVSVSAFNKDNTVQSYMKTSSFKANIKAEDTHLYMLIVGTDQYNDQSVNLKYAVKDARDIKEKLLSQSATLYKPENIHAVVLADKEATKANIQSQISMLAKKIKPADSFVLFVAGHGVLLQNQYFMLTHDFDGTISDNSMISSNEIVEASKQIKSLSQLFIFDTCHAGGVDYIVSGLYDARMSVLAKKMGLHIYASANDKQAAMDGYKGNGLFTYTLMAGLNNKKEADKNNDGAVSLVELGGYSKQATADISKEIGHSQTPLIINFGKDQPVYKLQNVR